MGALNIVHVARKKDLEILLPSSNNERSTNVSPSSTIIKMSRGQETKHPLEASQSWDLYTRRRQQEAEEEHSEMGSSVRRILTKTKVDDKKRHGSDDIQDPGAEGDPNIHVSHKPRKHKIPKAGGSTMHGIMIDAGSVRDHGHHCVSSSCQFCSRPQTFLDLDFAARYSDSHL